MDTPRALDTVHAVNWMAPAEDVLVQGADFSLAGSEFVVPGEGARGFSVETDAVVVFHTPRSGNVPRTIEAKAGRRYDVRVLVVGKEGAGTTATDLLLYL